MLATRVIVIDKRGYFYVKENKMHFKALKAKVILINKTFL